MKILLRNQHSKRWDVIQSAVYTAEKDLQALLADDPSLIAINEIREGTAPLVAGIREFGLPGSGSTDILAFSSSGDIAIIECKLAANPEIKRTVIAQVFEYAAYLWSMTYEDLNQLVVRRTNKNLADLVSQSAGESDWDEEEFRTAIQSNLDNGSFILVIAVDELNEELTRTIKFLNSCGNPSFSFTALEMRRYQKDQTEILVPHLFRVTPPPKQGQTKSRKQWTEEEFFQVATEELNQDTLILLKDLYSWSKSTADRIWFGTGSTYGSFTFHYLQKGKTQSVFTLSTKGALTLNYIWLSTQLHPEVMQAFHKTIVAIPGFETIPANYNTWPVKRIDQVFLNNPQNINRFKRAVEDLKLQIQ